MESCRSGMRLHSRHQNRAHVTALAEEINDGPVIVSLLKMRQLQHNQLGTPQAAA
jgi:hypothetical protein